MSNKDDMMDLLNNNSSKESLVICPSKRGNIDRFINGATGNNSNLINAFILNIIIYF